MRGLLRVQTGARLTLMSHTRATRDSPLLTELTPQADNPGHFFPTRSGVDGTVGSRRRVEELHSNYEHVRVCQGGYARTRKLVSGSNKFSAPMAGSAPFARASRSGMRNQHHNPAQADEVIQECMKVIPVRQLPPGICLMGTRQALLLGPVESALASEGR